MKDQIISMSMATLWFRPYSSQASLHGCEEMTLFPEDASEIMLGKIWSRHFIKEKMGRNVQTIGKFS